VEIGQKDYLERFRKLKFRMDKELRELDVHFGERRRPFASIRPAKGSLVDVR
jgi:hypothetical protein